MDDPIVATRLIDYYQGLYWYLWITDTGKKESEIYKRHTGYGVKCDIETGNIIGSRNNDRTSVINLYKFRYEADITKDTELDPYIFYDYFNLDARIKIDGPHCLPK